MTLRFRRWFHYKWRTLVAGELARAYHTTFSHSDGQIVIQHLMDSIYCTVYTGNDPIQAMMHNARRSVIQEILENIDMAENPRKYEIKVESTENEHAA